MEAIQVLCTKIHLEGKSSFVRLFSAKSISEDQNMSIYTARKLLKALRDYGLIYRIGNRYMMTTHGYNIAIDVIRAAQSVQKFQPAEAL